MRLKLGLVLSLLRLSVLSVQLTLIPQNFSPDSSDSSDHDLPSPTHSLLYNLNHIDQRDFVIQGTIMVGIKGAKGGGKKQKHLHDRIAYLYEAATYLTTYESTRPSASSTPDLSSGKHVGVTSTEEAPLCPERMKSSPAEPSGGVVTSGQGDWRKRSLARMYVSQLRSISLKSQIRLPHDMKRSICNRCWTLLIPQVTSTTTTENQSRGGKKPWAEVLVTRCNACGTEKRVPTGAPRQVRKTARQKKAAVTDHVTGFDAPNA